MYHGAPLRRETASRGCRGGGLSGEEWHYSCSEREVRGNVQRRRSYCLMSPCSSKPDTVLPCCIKSYREVTLRDTFDQVLDFEQLMDLTHYIRAFSDMYVA